MLSRDHHTLSCARGPTSPTALVANYAAVGIRQTRHAVTALTVSLTFVKRLKALLGEIAYDLYGHRLTSALPKSELPRHVGVILDGNRRWAAGLGSGASHGHRKGGEKIHEFLHWCEELEIEVVTLWLLSTDNLARESAELSSLLEIIQSTVAELAQTRRWRIHPVGALDLLPDSMREALQQAEASTSAVPGILVNVAIGYGGRREVVDAVRSLLLAQAAQGKSIDDVADSIEIEHIADHLYTRGQPDPDLVIRTSGEQRLSGFLLWQSAHSEFYFCEAYWPDFRKIDFLRALRSYAARHRRFGA